MLRVHPGRPMAQCGKRAGVPNRGGVAAVLAMIDRRGIVGALSLLVAACGARSDLLPGSLEASDPGAAGGAPGRTCSEGEPFLLSPTPGVDLAGAPVVAVDDT